MLWNILYVKTVFQACLSAASACAAHRQEALCEGVEGGHALKWSPSDARELLCGRDGCGKQVCLLLPLSGRAEPPVELFSARLLRIEARDVLIGGEEDF